MISCFLKVFKTILYILLLLYHIKAKNIEKSRNYKKKPQPKMAAAFSL